MIQAQNLSKLYGDSPALQNVSLDVAEGEFLALLGRNGAGKTTLLKLLALLTRPSFGSLSIAGVDQDGDWNIARRRVGLASFGKELVRNFSRGMRQRLTIGRLFLHNPDLLLLDEPFTGLDDRATALLEDLLRAAHRQGKTIVLCTHQLELALKLAHRLLILERGKVAYLGPNQPERMAEMRELYLQF